LIKKKTKFLIKIFILKTFNFSFINEYDLETETSQLKIYPHYSFFSQITPSDTNFFFLNLSSLKQKHINTYNLTFKHSHIVNFNLQNNLTSLPFIDNDKLNEKIPFETFFYLKKSSFISFFVNNLIDIPICFKKSKSLKNKNFELPLMKFVNYLMKKGKKEQTTRILFETFRMFLNNFKNNNLTSEIDLKS
jgi:hypothetical protein